MLAGMVRQTGSVRIVGDGRDHWPAVHVDDLATAYLSAVEQAASGDDRVTGQIFNVVAEDAVAVAEMGEAIRASVGADRVELWSLDDARKSLGLFADALALDQTVSGQHVSPPSSERKSPPGIVPAHRTPGSSGPPVSSDQICWSVQGGAGGLGTAALALSALVSAPSPVCVSSAGCGG